MKTLRNKETRETKLQKLRLRHNKHFCVYIGKGRPPNLVLDAFYGTTESRKFDCPLLCYRTDVYLAEILRDVGIAKSLSQAKGAGWLRKAEKGFRDYRLDRLKEWGGDGMGLWPHRMTIWKSLST